MAVRRSPLRSVLRDLEAQYGAPTKPLPRNPLEWILWENVAYLADDERHARAWRALAKDVGLSAERIAKAPPKALLATTKLGGIHPETRADRLREIAERALAEDRPDLAHVLRLPLAQARKVLTAYPAIGAPGADKILLACGFPDVFALESNGLRVLQRLGYGAAAKSYSTAYRSVLAAVDPELPRESAERWKVHVLLRSHGRALCKRTAPDCDACPVAAGCPSASTEGNLYRPAPRSGDRR